MASPLIVPVDVIVAFFAAIFVYYIGLFVVSKRDPRHQVTDDHQWGFVILIPAHNEELVIGDTVRRALALKAPIHLVVIDDGSNDATGAIVKQFTDSRVHVLTRTYPNAKQGKGEALNHAYQFALAHYDEWFKELPTSRIVVTVLDADGYLDPQLFDYVAGMLERSPEMGGVQTPVTIQDPERSMWLRLQDLEFVGFSCFVQQARHWFSSIGLGGNGQFVRASALEKLGDRPWRPALSEDLDIGIRLLLGGVKLGYCNMGFVHQQGLTKLKPLLKQRTRWVQGHYQAWKYLPSIWKSTLPLWTKIDLSLYLVLVASVLIIVVNMLLSLVILFGFLTARSDLLNSLFAISPYLGRSVQLLLSVGPALLFAATYNRYSRSRIHLLHWPAVIAIFCIYGWIWIYASIVALIRLARGKNNWVKTERIQLDPEPARK